MQQLKALAAGQPPSSEVAAAMTSAKAQGGGAGGKPVSAEQLARQAAKAVKTEAAEAARAERAAALAAELNSVDKVLDSRSGTAKAEEARGGRAEAAGAVGAVAVEEHFLCKLKGVAHVHAQWLTAAQIATDGRLSATRLQNFERKRAQGAQLEPYATYMEVDRVIAASGATPPTKVPTKARPAESDDDDDGGGGGGDDDDDRGVAQSPGAEGDDKGAHEAADEEAEALRWLESAEQLWLVKWRGLSYDHCTWESHRTAGGAHIASFKAREALVAARPPAAAAAGAPLQGGAASEAEKEDVPASFNIGRPHIAGGRALREYQRDGVRWLRYNYAQHRSAILGDEMGLGKTAQACVT